MTRGQRIGRYRKEQGLSQEALGERLGVSRQAVSKWETDAAVPDMENLLALSRLFAVPVSQLTDTPEEPASAQAVPLPGESDAPRPSNRQRLRWFLLLALVLACMAGALVYLSHAMDKGSVDAPPPVPSDTQSADASLLPDTEFLLRWDGPGEKTYLALGAQEDCFPFGTALSVTEPEQVLDTDFSGMTVHQADCGALTITYLHIAEDRALDPDAPERETVTAVATMVPGYTTPRDVGVGSTKAQVLAAYGDAPAYCLKEDRYTLVPHEYYYAFAPAGSGAAILFYMSDGQVSGIRLEALGEMPEAYEPDHLFRFPLKDGEPDFSGRQEPEREALSDTRKVYIAWNRLVTNNNLTAEEQYACRRDLFSLLPDMDWAELGRMGSLGEESDTILALMDYLSRQEPYSSSELLCLQMGCTAAGLDGAYTDGYCSVLSHALFCDPVAFAKCLATDGVPEETMVHAIRSVAYDAELYPSDLQNALAALNAALDQGSLSEAEALWTRLLLRYLTTPMDQRNDLPNSPTALS